ncbi:MAG: FUSC family protein [Nakamurella sp.]
MSRIAVAGRRLRSNWVKLVESTVAATLAWLVATVVVGHTAPFFAPTAAIIVLGQARGVRIRKTVEILIAIAGGVLLADVVAQLLGSHTTWTILVLMVATLTITTAIGANGVAVTQAAVSALYVAVVAPPTQTLVPVRFIDALVGGTIALVVSQLAVVRDPLAALVREMRGITEQICDVVDRAAAAIDQHDEAAATAALDRARQVDRAVDALRTEVAAAAEVLRLDVWRRERRAGVQTIETASRQIDYAVRGVRVLARAGLTLTRWPAPADPALGIALRRLTTAVGYTGEALAEGVLGHTERAAEFARRAETSAFAAIADARPLLWGDQPLPVVMIVGQLRSITIDLLRGVGADDATVLVRVDHALGFPSGAAGG